MKLGEEYVTGKMEFTLHISHKYDASTVTNDLTNS